MSHKLSTSYFYFSITVRTLKKETPRTLVRARVMNNEHMGRFFSVPDRNVAKVHAAGSQKAYRPLKKILGLNSMGTTARRLRGMTRNS